eukprot:1158890-Pelagomonas_calceolata.AAC.15
MPGSIIMWHTQAVHKSRDLVKRQGGSKKGTGRESNESLARSWDRLAIGQGLCTKEGVWARNKTGAQGEAAKD